jgi:hypothetical protein
VVAPTEKPVKYFESRFRLLWVKNCKKKLKIFQSMKTVKKTLSFAIITIALLFTSLILITSNNPVDAQLSAQQPKAGPLSPGVTPAATIDTIPYLSITPQTIGIGQTLLVNVWMIPPLHVQRQFIETFKVTFTRPDNSEIVIGPFDSFPADGTGWFDYPVDQVGTWKVKFDFLGIYFPQDITYKANYMIHLHQVLA